MIGSKYGRSIQEETMQTIKKILHTNKLMEKVCRFSGFQKLMLFWIPLILTGSFSYLMLQVFVFFPQSFTKISSFFLAWQMFVCWVWLFISFQMHWKRETRNLMANISVVSIAAALLILEIIL